MQMTSPLYAHMAHGVFTQMAGSCIADWRSQRVMLCISDSGTGPGGMTLCAASCDSREMQLMSMRSS